MTDAKRVINSWSGRLPLVLSAVAIGLLIVALTTGWERGLKDEGVVAHSWQLLVGLQLPLIVAFVSTADWRRPLGPLSLLGLQLLGLMLCMAPVAILKP